MAANKTDRLTIRSLPTGPWSNSSINPRCCPREHQAQSSLVVASSLSGIGLLLAVVGLIGCNGLAASRRTIIAPSVDSSSTTTANLPLVTVQRDYRTTSGQVSGGLTLNPLPTPKAAPLKPSSPARLQIMTDALPSGTTDRNYATKLVATGGVPPYSWDATAGQVAPGLTLRSSAGIISGIPFAAGTFSFRARVQDSTGAFISTDLSLNISAALPPTAFDVVPDAGSVDGGTVVMISDQSRIRR